MKKLAMFTLAAALSAIPSVGQVTSESLVSKVRSSVSDSRAAADKGLQTLRQLVTEKTSRDYGFASAGEAQGAAVGEALVVFVVRLDQLRQYQSGDGFAMLTGGDKVIYPVMADRQVRSSIVVDKVNGVWRAASFGGSNFTKILVRLRAGAGALAFAIEVPALSYYALGTINNGQLLLTSMTDHPEAGLKADATDPAQRVFAQLAPVARAYNGLPR